MIGFASPASVIDPICYFHIELAEHDIIFAEGAPAETFLDCGNRGMFHNAAKFAALYPNHASLPQKFRAAVVERGRRLAAIQRRLARRAGEAGIAGPQDGPMQGRIDQAETETITGWAWLGAHPGVKVLLEVIVDGERVAEVLANRHRADLQEAGYGDGRHSFELRLPRPLDPFRRHELVVRRSADRLPLGQPLVIWPARSLDGRARTGLAAAIGAARRAAATVAEADALLETLAAEMEQARQERLALLPRPVRRRRRGGDAGPDRRALIIDETWPRPDHDAGSQAVLSHMRALRRLGWQVEFIAARAMDAEPRAAALLQAERIAAHAPPAVHSVEELLRRQPDRYGLVYLHRAGPAAAYVGLARQHQRRARLLYNVADLHHLRLARQAQIEGRPEIARAARAMQAQEFAAMRQADAVITHSDAEAALISRAAPGVPVHVVPWAVSPWKLVSPAASRSGVLMVANFAHAPNLDAAGWLVSEVMPRVWASHPDLLLTIVGAGLPPTLREKFAAARGPVRLPGYVWDLDGVYSAARVVVAPLRFGAGLKGKVLEAWAAGVPCALTPIAAEGLPLPGELERTVADGAPALARLILDLHADADRAELLRRAGRMVLRREFSRARESELLTAAVAPARPAAPVRSVASDAG